MTPIPNPQVLYAKHPVDFPVPGEHLVYDPEGASIDLENVPLNGGVLLKTLYVSIDPYTRSQMRDASVRSFSPAFTIGKPGNSTSVVKVLRSESEKYKAGDHLETIVDWRAYQVLPADNLGPIIENPYGLPWHSFVGVAGVTAQTAFYGLRTFAQLKVGETIFVSTAAGAVGSMVVQLAKLAGLKVIASTGSDSKVDYLTSELNADVAFNYKKNDVWDVLKEHGPIDVYWDNVGGEQLDAALKEAAYGARFLMCGYLSEYMLSADQEPYGLKNGKQILTKAIQMHGFHIWPLMAKLGMAAWTDEYLPLVRDGKVKMRLQSSNGFENLAKALDEILKGDNTGKAVVVVAEA